jgi:integrase/recombinase XerD
MKLATCLHQFFGHYLTRIKGVSAHTLEAYRQTFTLFLPFAAKYCGIKVESLLIDHLSAELILDFLDELQKQRGNCSRTRNQRLAALKSFAKMIRFISPEHKPLADRILHIPQKRMTKPLMGFLNPEEIFNVFRTVNLKQDQGFRDFSVLHLLYDSGARASEIAELKLNYFDPDKRTLAILGKGKRYRQIELWPKTAQLLTTYLKTYRPKPRILHRDSLFINQRGEALTRHGIYRICQKYLKRALSPKQLKHLNPVHCFRHSCAVNMLVSGYAVSDIRNRLGHENLQSTTVYLHLDLSRKKEIQKQFIAFTQSFLSQDPQIEELIDWENKDQILDWLDSL